MKNKQCYICKKEIKKSQEYYDIGQDLFRHKKCKPYKRRKK